MPANPHLRSGLQQMPGDAGQMDFIGSIVDAGGAFLAVEEAEDGVVGDTQCAVDLDGAVNNVVEHPCSPEFDKTDFGASFTPRINGARGVESHHPSCLNFCR